MNNKVYEYEAVICNADGKDGAYVAFPYDIRKEFGQGRVKVHATFDGEPYDGSVVWGSKMRTEASAISLAYARTSEPGSESRKAIRFG